MKYFLLIVFVFLSSVIKAQIPLKPCKIFYMNQRQYAYVYRDNDSLRKALVASITKDNRSEFPKLGIDIANGYYLDSAGTRYYYAHNKELWKAADGKILKTVP